MVESPETLITLHIGWDDTHSMQGIVFGLNSPNILHFTENALAYNNISKKTYTQIPLQP
jgi:hypothetical protein